jgi:hypothetical protein
MASYIETAIDEAFKKAKGNQTKARVFILEQLKTDDQLLRALALPHINAIVAHAVNRIAIQQKSNKKKKDDASVAIPKGAKAEAGFGLDLLKALGGQNVPKFGREDAAPPLRRKDASQTHVNALKLMASKSSTKSKTKPK